MKSFLKMLATITLTTAVATPLINQSILKENDIPLIEGIDFYWFRSHEELEIQTNWLRPKDEISFIFKVNIGQEKITNFKTVSAIDPNNTSYSKMSWGNTAYYGKSFSKVNNVPIRDVFVNYRIWTITQIKSNSRVELFNIEDGQGLASMKAKAAVGFSSYYENGDNFIQFFGFFSVQTWTSMSNGGVWINLAQGFSLDS